MVRLFAQIIVDIAHAEVDRLFTYAVPAGMPLADGHHVLVPFGRGNTLKEGFVVGTSAAAPKDISLVKEVAKILEPYPVLTEQQLALAQWIKRVYHCLLVDALRLMIPAQMRGSRVHEKTERMLYIPDGVDVPALLAGMETKKGEPKSPRQAEILTFMRHADKPVSYRELTARFPGAESAIKALRKKAVLQEELRELFRQPGMGKTVLENTEVALTQEQGAAIAAIQTGIDNGKGIFLLHGVTGSGKTEVYMRCMQRCLDSGREAILLVPEIVLTPQAMGLFRARFGDAVAVLHSRLSAGERFDEWRRIRLGIARVAIGARSAVFAPFENLGLIVVDEEHEQSYQSETRPRYHAVEVAIRRCAMAGAPLVLGSATPSLQTYMRARAGRYELLELPERVKGIRMPEIEIVDMREEFLAGNNGIFSAALHEKLSACFGAGKQAILFINRRGYSTFISCRGCGHVFQCPNCDISTTYHRTEERMKCHYCGYTAPVPTHCPSCGKPYIKYFGVGTQQVEEQLRQQFPGVAVLRMDRDSTQTKDSHEQLLEIFARGDAQVLVGTQMVAKGLDFPNVTLVGVVAADSTLHLPDYRSAERTFQLLAQVAGRAGRSLETGSVVVQTYSPGHPSIRFAKTHDYKGFFAYEISERHAALFPPFSLFVRVLLQSAQEEGLVNERDAAAKGLREAIEQALGMYKKELLYISAAPAPVYRKQNVYRHQVLIKLLRSSHTTDALNALYAYLDEHVPSCFASLEVNPGDLI